MQILAGLTLGYLLSLYVRRLERLRIARAITGKIAKLRDEVPVHRDQPSRDRDIAGIAYLSSLRQRLIFNDLEDL